MSIENVDSSRLKLTNLLGGVVHGYQLVACDVDEVFGTHTIYSYVLEFTDFFEFEITPVQKIDDAVAPMFSYLGVS